MLRRAEASWLVRNKGADNECVRLSDGDCKGHQDTRVDAESVKQRSKAG